MKEIKLTNGSISFVDDEDYPILSRHSWYTSQGSYPRTMIMGKFIFMHDLVVPSRKRGEKCRYVDHIDRNPLNNQKANLRMASKQQNSLNSKLRRDNPSGVKGVRLLNGWYYAYTTLMGKQVVFGKFTCIEDARRARVEGMLRLHGPEFLNET